ncbi:MAG TPA: lmo0937 family membrane protein [Thermoanaerobaculia bacterium]
MGNLLWLIIVVLIVLWLAGFAFQFGGGLIHILIVIALILLIVRLATGRKVL